MKAVLVGRSGTMRELLRRLGEGWQVTVVDPAPQPAAGPGDRRVTYVAGDGTSRLVLERAGLAEADALVAATGDDDANLEVCRLGQAAGILRVVAVAGEPERLGEYRERGIFAVSPSSLAARRLEVQLENRRIASMAFAEGRAEAIEFRVSHDAPVRDRALRDLHDERWIVGAVLRGEELIIPHGDTLLREGDLVTVVGAGKDFAEIVRAFTAGEARFPLGFGKRVAVALEASADATSRVVEASSLVRNSGASSLLLVHRSWESLRDEDAAARVKEQVEEATRAAGEAEVRRRPVKGSPSRALIGPHAEESIGVLVLPPPRGNWLTRFLRARGIVRLARSLHVPVLVARGTHPYRHILVPARRTPSGDAAMRAAIDLARYANADVTGLVAIDPLFLGGEGASFKARQAIDWFKQEASMQRVAVRGHILKGNPVRSFLSVQGDSGLLVLGASSRALSRFGVSVVGHILSRSRLSVLVVPVRT